MSQAISEKPPAGPFLTGLLLRTTTLLLAVACVNYVVNPFGVYGTRIFAPIRVSSRLPKLAAYAQRDPKPAIVILGSSRSFTMEPAYIEAKTSRPAFNAAVHAGSPSDYGDLARCFANEGGLPPVLVVGLGVEQMLHDDGQPIERPDPFARCRDARMKTSLLADVRSYHGLFTLEESWAAWRVLGFELVGRPPPLYTFAADGVVKTNVPAKPLKDALQESLAGSWSPATFDAQRLDPNRLETMRQLLELCRRSGSKLVVYLPPYHPKAVARYLSESHFASLRQMLLDQLAEWAKRYPLRYYDFSEASRFGASEEMFLDASHPREDACRLMMDAMLSDLI